MSDRVRRAVCVCVCVVVVVVGAGFVLGLAGFSRSAWAGS